MYEGGYTFDHTEIVKAMSMRSAINDLIKRQEVNGVNIEDILKAERL